MADTRRIFSWLAVAGALALAAVLVLLVLREDDKPAAKPPAPPVVSRPADDRTPPARPVISVPVQERKPTGPPKEAPNASAGSVTGRLVDPQRQPLPGCRIEALQGDNGSVQGLVALQSLGKRAVADADGRFTLDGVPAMSDLMLRLDGDTFPLLESGPILVQAGQATDLGEMVMQPGMIVTGTVFDERGAAIAGARVGLLQGSTAPAGEAADEDSIPEPARLVLTDAAGRFRVANAQPASFLLAVSAKGFANTLVPGGPGPDERVPQLDVPVLMKRAGRLRGRVVDRADEHALPGVRIHAEPMDQGSGRSEAVTGADGRFTLDDVVPGNYALSAVLAGYSRGRERSFDETPDADVVFKLDAQGSLAGTVIGSDGQPVRGFDLQPRYRKRRLDPAVPHGSFQRIASADGGFIVKDLDPGFWSVDVWAKGYSLTSSEPVKVKQGDAVTGLLVTLVRGSEMSGIVRDAEGHPVAGAEVSLHENREPEVDFLRDTTPIPGVTHGTRTDAEGRFQLEDLSARKYQVQVDHPDFAILRRNDVALVAEQKLEVEPFVLQRSSTVKGAAVTASGEPLAGVTVSLTALEGFSRQTVTDGRGLFQFTRVREGDYQLVCYGRQLSLGAMLASVRNPPETFHVDAGASVQRNAQSLE